MAYDEQALIDQLGTLTIMELADLIDGLKETWGVTAAVAAGPAAGAAAPVAEEKTEFDVVLIDVAVIGLIGFAIDRSIALVQRYALRWQTPAR